MWTRRLVLATLVAAAAMSLPRHLPASWGSGMGSAPVTLSALR